MDSTAMTAPNAKGTAIQKCQTWEVASAARTMPTLYDGLGRSDRSGVLVEAVEHVDNATTEVTGHLLG